MRFENILVKDLLKKLGKRKNITMAISDSVQGKISINFENVTFEVALKHHTFSQRAVHASLIKKRQSN